MFLMCPSSIRSRKTVLFLTVPPASPMEWNRIGCCIAYRSSWWWVTGDME
uniref:Glycerophosphodiester phosphodiesterase GDPD1ic-like n=1 Tax=Rhizophora mucronata TaxID=61149 RepID=A0A2P2JFT5_RHIMU